MAQATTIDGLLNRRITLEQPADGYRVAIDTVLLAAAVPAEPRQSVLELGCGVGGAMLCLACRVPDLMMTGVEIQPGLAALARANIERNSFAATCAIQNSDVTSLTAENIFDHVFMNPPYHDAKRHDASAHDQKRVANTDSGELVGWIETAARALKPGGTLTLIHRADRQDEIVALSAGHFGALELLPIFPKDNTPPKRLILRARKGAPSSLTRCKNLVLHQPDGGFTSEAEDILRHMKLLRFVPAE